jgi:cullin 1
MFFFAKGQFESKAMARCAMSLSDVWARLRPPLWDFLSNRLAGLTRAQYMNLYSLAFMYENAANADHLAFYVNIADLLRARAAELAKEALTLPEEELSSFCARHWEAWSLAVRVIAHILEYLNRKWIKNQRQRNGSVYEIETLGDAVWRDEFAAKVQARLTPAIVRLIDAERDGRQILWGHLRSCLACFVRMGVDKSEAAGPTLKFYEEYFQDQFLKATEVYYAGESARLVAEAGVSCYMQKVEARFEEEADRVKRYLNAATLPPLISKLEAVLIASQRDVLCGNFTRFLKEEATADLKRSYRLLLRVGAAQTLRELFQRFACAAGLEALERAARSLPPGDDAPETPKVFVDELLAVFRKLAGIVSSCFAGDATFAAALDQACRHFVNHNAITESAAAKERAKKQTPAAQSQLTTADTFAPTILGKYCDAILRKGPSFISDETEMERTLSDVTAIFKYFPDKDIFMTVYQRLLSKRLITGASASIDAEKLMVQKLKAIQGFEYCLKLQRMITDVELGTDTSHDFQACLAKQGLAFPFGFNVAVLTTGVWPLSGGNTDFQIPAELLPAVEAFRCYYDGKYQGRRLTYLHHVSRADVQFRPKKGLYRLATTTYQMGVLVAFAGAGGSPDRPPAALTFQELGGATLLSGNALRAALVPLVHLKLLKCSGGDDAAAWGPGTAFAANDAFASRRPRLNCALVAHVEDARQAERETKREVEEERILKLKAAIVRIMKARKNLGHTALIQETIAQVNGWFQPKVPVIKRTIEALLEEEYLRRSKDSSGKDLQTYEYVA